MVIIPLCLANIKRTKSSIGCKGLTENPSLSMTRIIIKIKFIYALGIISFSVSPGATDFWFYFLWLFYLRLDPSTTTTLHPPPRSCSHSTWQLFNKLDPMDQEKKRMLGHQS